jgi:hypothetical protein
MTPSGTGGVVNDAVAIYFADATLFRVREDEHVPRRGGSLQDAMKRIRRSIRIARLLTWVD